jgi:hypothetical protein
VAERPAGAKQTIVPNYVTETGYIEDITGRTNVGDAQDRRLLAVLNLKTGQERVGRRQLRATRRGARPEPPRSPPPRRAQPAGGTATPKKRSARSAGARPWSQTTDVRRRGARSTDNKDRWIVTLDAETGKTQVIDVLHDDAWIRERCRLRSDRAVEFLPDNKRDLVPLGTRRLDAPLHAGSVGDGAKPKQLTSGKWEITPPRPLETAGSSTSPAPRRIPASGISIRCPLDGGDAHEDHIDDRLVPAEISPDESTLGLVYSYSNKPPEVFVMPNQPGAAASRSPRRRRRSGGRSTGSIRR